MNLIQNLSRDEMRSIKAGDMSIPGGNICSIQCPNSGLRISCEYDTYCHTDINGSGSWINCDTGGTIIGCWSTEPEDYLG